MNDLILSFQELQALNSRTPLFTNEEDLKTFYEAHMGSNFQVASLTLFRALSKLPKGTFYPKEASPLSPRREKLMDFLIGARLDDFLIDIPSAFFLNNAGRYFMLDLFTINGEKASLVKLEEVLSLFTLSISSNREEVLAYLKNLPKRFMELNGTFSREYLGLSIEIMYLSEAISCLKEVPDDLRVVSRLCNDFKLRYEKEIYEVVGFLDRILNFESEKVSFSYLDVLSISARGREGYDILTSLLLSFEDFKYGRLVDIRDGNVYGDIDFHGNMNLLGITFNKTTTHSVVGS